MNLKHALLLPGTIALVLSTSFALPVMAQTEAPTRPARERVNKLNLTDEQKTRLREIRESTRTQIDAVLNEDQKAQLEAARQQNPRSRKAFSALNLSDEQKARIREIRENAKRQMDEILTDDQKQQLQQRRSMRRGAQR